MTKKPCIILVDDNKSFLGLIASLPEAAPYDVITFTAASEALQKINQIPVDLLIADVQMPEISGTELFAAVQDQHPDIPVILITAFGSTEEALQAVKQGAFHYFEKPLDDKLDLFWSTVRQAIAKREMLREIALHNRAKALAPSRQIPIIGDSAQIRDITRSINEITGLPVTVLITGQTGTGKGLVAQTIHQASPRKEKPFFTVNCNEFAPGVLESELFGHEKGAFTGAIERKKGIFEITHEGTLVLDEISEAPPATQSKLLRVLEDKCFTRVGSTDLIHSDFRIIATTNQDLKQGVEKGKFREDLYYRLNVYTIEMPLLRNRKEDIPLLAEFYLRRFSQAYGRHIDHISQDAMLALGAYDWPGNVRELINIIERGVITCQNSVLTTQSLPFDLKNMPQAAGLNLTEMEKFYIYLALKHTGNNKSKASELLGISRKTLIEKLKKYNGQENNG